METYRQQFTIEPTAVDRYKRLKISMLLLYVQEISGHHSDELGQTYAGLAQRGLFWAVIRNRVQITRLPVEGETITLKTWPMPTTRAAYPRATAAYDAEGKEIFRCTSLWVLMDIASRAMILPGKSGVEVPGVLRGNELAAPKSLMPKELREKVFRKVCFTDLDCNGHMNNARYLDWVADLLPSEFHREHPVQEFTLCYLNESLEADALDVNWEIDDTGTLNVDIHRGKGDGDYDRIFAARISYM